jgi:hypothetical protein
MAYFIASKFENVLLIDLIVLNIKKEYVILHFQQN